MTETPGTELTIPAGEVKLRADAHGDPADTPVVLLHGGGQTRRSWGTTAADLGEYLPHRPQPRNVDGLRKNLRHADGRWF